MRSRRNNDSVMRRARPVTGLLFLLLLATLAPACTSLGITGPGPSCLEMAEEDFPTGDFADCNSLLDE
jgi:hypothetical protein